MQQEEIVNKHNLTSGNDAPERDLKSRILNGFNDAQNWTERNQTKEYKYYRISITTNKRWSTHYLIK